MYENITEEIIIISNGSSIRKLKFGMLA